MRFSIRTLLAFVALFASVSVTVIVLLPKPRLIPECIGERLSVREIGQLLDRYGADKLVSQSKSEIYANADRTFQIEMFDDCVVNVQLTLPLDASLKIAIPKNVNRIIDGCEYSKTTASGKETLSIFPESKVLRDIYGNISYTVSSDQPNAE